MKIWKLTILSSMLLMAVLSAVLYSSCVQNTCTNVTCLHGGSCGNGVCRCPTGYEGPTCATLSVTRFVGGYAGYTSCNNTQQVIDSAFITANSEINTVSVKMNSISPKILQGYISNNQSTYSIIVTNSDSSKSGSTFYQRIFTITLQSDKSLSIHEYEKNIFETLSGPDTIISNCTFLGFKY